MNEQEQNVEIRCENCGATFSAFLQQMAQHNQRIVCPRCARQTPAATHYPSTTGADKPKKT